MNKRIILLFLWALLCSAGTIHAQVTIGSENEPRKGTILDLKETKEDLSAGTAPQSGLALGLPRVALSSETTLTVASNASDKDKRVHEGIMVYNTNTNVMQGTGVYVWDGAKWIAARAAAATVWNGVASKSAAKLNTEDAYLKAKVVVNGEGLLSQDAALSVHGNAVLSGNLTANGNSTLKNTTVNGTLNATGKASIGTSTTARPGTRLDLNADGKDTNMGLGMPRVALAGRKVLTIGGTNEENKGVVVYNTGKNEDMVEGLDAWVEQGSTGIPRLAQ